MFMVDFVLSPFPPNAKLKLLPVSCFLFVHGDFLANIAIWGEGGQAKAVVKFSVWLAATMTRHSVH